MMEYFYSVVFQWCRCFHWLGGNLSPGFPLWVAWWWVMKGLTTKASIMRGCSRVLLIAMCSAYCTFHTDPSLILINAFRARVAVAILPNERKMSRCSLQQSLLANHLSVHTSLLRNTSPLYVKDACSTSTCICVWASPCSAVLVFFLWLWPALPAFACTCYDQHVRLKL